VPEKPNEKEPAAQTYLSRAGVREKGATPKKKPDEDWGERVGAVGPQKKSGACPGWGVAKEAGEKKIPSHRVLEKKARHCTQPIPEGSRGEKRRPNSNSQDTIGGENR